MTISAQEAKQLLAENVPQGTTTPQQTISPEEARRLLAQEAQPQTQIQQATGTRQPVQRSLLERLADNPIVRFINQMGPAAQQTIADFATGTANLAARGITQVLAPGFPQRAVPQLRTPQLEPKGLPLAPRIAGSLIGGLPLMALAPGATAETLLGRLGQQALTGAGLQSAFAASQPDADIGKAAGIGGAIGALLQAPAELLNIPLASLLRRAEIPGSPIRSPEEVGALSKQLGNTPVSLGDIVNSPGLRRLFHTVLGSFPGSGVAGLSERSLAETQNIANNLETHLRTDTPTTDILNSLRKSLRNTRNKTETISEQNYQNVTEDADTLGFNLDKKPLTQAKAKEILAREKAIVSKGDLGVLDDDNKATNILENLSKDQEVPPTAENTNMIGPDGRILDIPGKPLSTSPDILPKISSFEASQGTRSKLLELSRQHARDDNLGVSQMYSTVAATLSKDINNEFKRINDPLLSEKWRNANQYFRENVVPNRKASISNVLDKQGKGIETIHNKLVTAELQHVLKNMSPGGRRLVGYRHFASANSFPLNATTGDVEARPGIMAAVYNRLGKNKDLIKRLFTPEENEEFRRLGAHVKVTREGQLAQAPPATGFRTARTLLQGAGIGGGLALERLLGLPITGGLIGGTALGARGLSKFLTSPRLRQAFIEQRPLLQRLAPSLSALTAAQLNQLRRGRR